VVTRVLRGVYVWFCKGWAQLEELAGLGWESGVCLFFHLVVAVVVSVKLSVLRDRRCVLLAPDRDQFKFEMSLSSVEG